MKLLICLALCFGFVTPSFGQCSGGKCSKPKARKVLKLRHRR